MDNYYYYTTKEIFDSGTREGWRVCKNKHPLTAVNLNKAHVTFWEKINEALAKELIRRYKNDKWNLSQDGSFDDEKSP